jgi:hypothetical protein
MEQLQVAVKYVINLFYLLLELHMSKVVVLSMMCLAVFEVCGLYTCTGYMFVAQVNLINLVLVVLVVLLLALPALDGILVMFAAAYITLIVAIKMIYQLNMTRELYIDERPNCVRFSCFHHHLTKLCFHRHSRICGTCLRWMGRRSGSAL